MLLKPRPFLPHSRCNPELFAAATNQHSIKKQTINAPSPVFPARLQARITVVDFLKEKGLFRGTEDNPMRLGLCSRSKDVIEPVLKPQWWVACKDMAARSCAAVRDGTLQIIPQVGARAVHMRTWL